MYVHLFDILPAVSSSRGFLYFLESGNPAIKDHSLTVGESS